MQSEKIRPLLRCYFILGSSQAGSRQPLQILEEALKGGATLFQFREKGENSLAGEDKRRFAADCQKICRRHGVPFIVNDDPELALELGADGIHVGQEDEPEIWVPRFIAMGKIAGLSVHTLEQAERAAAWKASYIGVGPVYATPSKDDAREPDGTRTISEICKHFPELPITAIGGLTAANTPPVIRAGADGVSVISAIAGAPDIGEAAKEIRGTVESQLRLVSEEKARDRGKV